MKNLEKIEIYTDGSCLGNQFSRSDGGYGAIVITPDETIELAQGYRDTTNNRMELRAVIAALQTVQFESDITVFSDSKYVIDAFNQRWIDSWIKRGWRKSNHKPVENQDLWKELLEYVHGLKMRWVWVKGHSGNAFNERADFLANTAAANGNKRTDYGNTACTRVDIP
jgi:ribonuclease HI